MYKVLWDVLMGFIYLICYLIDPYTLAFKFRPFLEKPELNTFSRVLTIMIIFDMILTPFTAIPREESLGKENKGQNKYKKYAVTTSNDKKSYGLDDPLM